MKEMLEVKQTIKETAQELAKEIKTLNLWVENLEKKEENTEDEIVRIRSEFNKLAERLDDNKQYRRKTNIIICGLPNKKDEEEEELKKTMKDLAGKLEVTMEEYGICAVHRLSTRRKQQPIR